MRKRRWLRRLGKATLALALLGPPLAFGISNLFLISPKGRSLVAGRIQRIILLETSVQGSTWSPWNGFTVYGLLIQQPAPLQQAIPAPILTAESIRIHPDWRVLAKRRIAIRGIEIHKPNLAVPIELLSQIPAAPIEPTIAAKPPDLAAVEDTSQTDLPPPIASVSPLPEGAAPIAEPPRESIKPAIDPTPTVWIRVSEGKFRVLSTMTKPPLFGISHINGAIPVGGKPAQSELSLRGIGCLGNEMPDRLRVPLKWQAPLLEAGVVEADAWGITCKLEAKIALTPGIPFLIGGSIPEQKGKEIVLSEGTRAECLSVAGQARLQGLLLAPGSWQGQALVRMLGIETEYAGQKANFNHGQALTIFQGGVLRCLDARMVGEQTSLLGNAMLLSDGRFAAVARVVAAPETLVAISRHTQPSHIAPQLTPLSTPQRAALDMRVFGSPGNVFYQPHPAAEPILLR